MQTLRKYSICDIQDEIRALVERGSVGRKSRIYELGKHFSSYEWQDIERLLESNDYLLRDCVADLIGKDSWLND